METQKADQSKVFSITIDDYDYTVNDPVVTGRQLLNLAEKRPPEEHLIYLIKQDGILEDISLEETVDLRKPGHERFITFKSDRSFRFELDSRRQDWGAPKINGATLHELARVGEEYVVWLEVKDDPDRLIEPQEMIDLTTPGVERFYTALKPTLEFEIIVNGRPRVVKDQVVTFEQLVQLAFPNSQSDPNVVFTITYRHAASKPHADNLYPEGFVEVKMKGTIFNVTRAIKS